MDFVPKGKGNAFLFFLFFGGSVGTTGTVLLVPKGMLPGILKAKKYPAHEAGSQKIIIKGG
jgi:hypothetical protein